MSYIHTDIFTHQIAKVPGNLCGDVIGYRHDEDATTLILADGLGAGVKANIAAEMCVSRFLSLIGHGASLREAFAAMVKTMNSAWGRDEAFSVFSVARILNNGNTTVLSYDSPAPILVTNNYAKVLSDRVYTLENAVICENFGKLNEGEGLLIMSDGITQAGIGNGLKNGWGSDGIAKYLNKRNVLESIDGEMFAIDIYKQAKSYWGKSQGDDCSVLFAKNRKGITVNILSGPPVSKNDDNQMVSDFYQSKGIKVICGGSTAILAARELKKTLESEKIAGNNIAPPSYKIDGINLVTEGIVTLNQVYNLMDEESEAFEEDSPVFELLEMLNMADRVNIFQGRSSNPAGANIVYRQQGILPRKKILQLIKDKLIEQGKLVVGYEY